MPGPDLLAAVGPDGSLHPTEIVTGLIVGGVVSVLVALRPAAARYAGALLAVALAVGLGLRSLPGAGVAVVGLASLAVELDARARAVIAATALGTVGVVAVDQLAAWWPLPVVVAAGAVVVAASMAMSAAPSLYFGWPLLPVAAASGWAAVPDTENAALTGAALVAALPVGWWLRGVDRSARASAFVAGSLAVVWAVVVGASGRPAAVVGGLSWLPLGFVLARGRVGRAAWSAAAGWVLVSAGALGASRVAGDEERWLDAGVAAAAVVVPVSFAVVALGRLSGPGRP